MASLFQEIIFGVDWSEPWLLGLLCFHLATSVSIVLLQHYVYIQAFILVVLAILCFSCERINEYAALNYEWFSKEQYFDSNGFFIFTVFAGPIIFNCFLIVLSWLWKVWNMMIKVGAMKRKAKKNQTKDKANQISNPRQSKKEK